MALDPARREQLAELSQVAAEQAKRDQAAINEEKRKPLYNDVRELLNPGFLSHRVMFRGSVLCLRAPAPGDMFLLRNRVPPKASDREWKEWMVATCIWMVDGYSFLEDVNVAVRLHQSLRYIPGRSLNVLWSVIHGLMNRVSVAVSRAEAYCYERQSRALWRFCGRQSPARDEFTGTPGSSRLGMNIVQQIWVAYNTTEDERFSDLHAWNSAKLIASAQAPKGIKKLNQADDQKEKQEQRRRERVRDQMYYEAVGWRDVHKDLVFQPHTAEELVEQMRRWRDGEKDLHDIVVDAWRDRVRDQIEKQEQEREHERAERERARKAAEENMGDLGIVGYSLDQVQDMVRDRSKFRTKIVDENALTRRFNKYVETGAEDIGYMSQGGARPAGAPEPPTVSERLAGRQTQFKTGGSDSFVPPAMRERFQSEVNQHLEGGGPPIANEGGEDG